VHFAQKYAIGALNNVRNTTWNIANVVQNLAENVRKNAEKWHINITK
jgi:hypothetical protein